MAIINATPDSFFVPSRATLNEVANTAARLAQEGADILDIGAESTRPGSHYIDEAEELKRLLPILKAVRKATTLPISIDTRKASVLAAALQEGADILNDISALEDDDKMATLVAKANIPVILMHKNGEPQTMQAAPLEKDGFVVVDKYLKERASFAAKSGILPNKIILDPGIGFGKNNDVNMELITKAGLLAGGQYPVLVGLSHKRVTGGSLEKTVALNMLAIKSGARIIRVHEVPPHIAALKSLCNSEN